MEEKKEEEITSNTTAENSSDSTPEAENKEENKEVEGILKTFEDAKESEKKEGKTVSVKSFLVAVGIIILIVLGFVYLLEKEGKITSNVFTDSIPVAKVDGKIISVRDFENNYRQLEQQAQSQGYDTEDLEIVNQIKEQVMDNLINFELLRREAEKAGKTVGEDELQVRVDEIIESIGGEELLGERLAELGIEKKDLLKEVKDDIIIQKLFEEDIFPNSDAAATEEEIAEFYEQLGGGEGIELPPLEEIEEQIAGQIEMEKQQKIIGDYLEELKNNSNIEIVS